MKTQIINIFIWSSFLIIPIFFELGSSLYASFVSAKNRNKRDGEKELEFFPIVTLLIPVYNSYRSLEKCLQSLYDQSYPLENLEVFLINNGEIDLSYDIFKNFQKRNDTKIWWINTENGKAKALNQGIYASQGKYIINIDSDGWLDKDAIHNVVKKFENNKDISCMSGVVLIDTGLFSKNIFKRVLQKCEYYEYCDSFLVGKVYESEKDSIYTLSGAFSCFRKEALTKTQMYNHKTLGEDVHMTFQIKKFNNGKVKVCEDAFFYTEPIDDLIKLQSQRQRWQRSEIEVANLFKSSHLEGSFFKNYALRRIVLDHTMVFLKLIWVFAIYFLYFLGYTITFILQLNLIMYALYVFNGGVHLLVSMSFLSKRPYLKRFSLRNGLYMLIMPLYRILLYFIRLAGIINSLTEEAKWNSEKLQNRLEKS